VLITRIAATRRTVMKIFHGWVIVAVGIVVTCIGMGTMMSLGVFLQPISQSMGWSRTGISTTALLNFLAMGLGSLLWGAVSDRFGTRFVVLCGGLLLGVGLVASSQVATLLEFQLVFGVSVGLAAGAFYVPLTSLATRWFTRHRSLAVALVSAGLALGSAVIAPLARWVILNHDWRFALLTLAAISWAVILPAAWLLREPPQASGADAPAAAETVSGMTVRQALQTPQFAAISLANFLCCAAHSGPIFHMVSYAVDCGVSGMAATTVFGVAGIASLTGRIVCGLVADRVGAKRTLVAGLALQALAVSLYLVTANLGSFYIVAAVFGFSYGGVMPLYAILVREYFPAGIMGSVFGVVAMISALGMALGPPIGGWLFDSFGSYAWLYIGSAGFGLAAAAIAFTVRPPRLAPIARLSPTAA
jgi:MFS family permease